MFIILFSISVPFSPKTRVNLVDLVKSLSLFLNLLFETDPYSNEYLLLKIYLQNTASIQPRTGRPLKFLQKLAEN